MSFKVPLTQNKNNFKKLRAEDIILKINSQEKWQARDLFRELNKKIKILVKIIMKIFK